jgi:hypothetical protein
MDRGFHHVQLIKLSPQTSETIVGDNAQNFTFSHTIMSNCPHNALFLTHRLAT